MCVSMCRCHVSLSIVSPTLTTLPQNTAAPLGATATLTCVGVGSPPPMVEWYLEEELVGEESQLSVDEVDRESAGMYMCQVSNEAGSVTMVAELTVYGKSVLFSDGWLNVTINRAVTTMRHLRH